MQFITSLFGGSGNSILTVVFALGIVLVLIVLAVWLLKLIYSASGNVARGRNRRLSVIDSLAIDQKRHLIVIRRDNVEHLILVGGPQDVVIETGIAVPEAPAGQSSRRPVPMVAAPQPQRRPGAKPNAPATQPGQNAPAVRTEPTAIERLRDLGQPAAARSAKSLRHTGLLRPVADGQPAGNAGNTDNSPQSGADSAKEEATQRVVEDADRDGHNKADRT